MDAHFQAFSFVDRITSVDVGRQIRGRFSVPSEFKEFPLSLVGEAVGQLAAWAAMAAVEFAYRPVAGLAGCIELFEAPAGGDVLELAAELENVDSERAGYQGTAHVDGKLVIRLQDCVGPMVNLDEFDDPTALRTRFKLLCERGATRRAFPSLPPLSPERTGGEPGRFISADFVVPPAAPLFDDHFPRRPVFPGSLLMHLNLLLGASLAAELPRPAAGHWGAETILDMKLRSFIPPGAALKLSASVKQLTANDASLAFETRIAEELIATSRLALKPVDGA